MNLSISQINKTGKKIRHSLRDDNVIQPEHIEKLQAYRISHQNSLKITFDYLVKRSKYHHKGSLSVYRLKRIDTILRKIERYKTMAMSTMQDIAGCRTIVASETQIYKIVDDFNNNPDFEIIGFDDYILSPRDTGYSCYHLIVRPINEVRTVEIQIRTRSQHFWATLVEITDVLFKLKLKEGADHPELYSFHKLLSKGKDNLTFDDKTEIVKIDRKYDIITKLTSVFKSNYIISIKRWIEGLDGKDNKYLIMELDKDLSPNFHFYTHFIEAERAYFNKFELEEPNMVLIHITQPDFEKIGLAYSNYVLTSHPSVRVYLDILQRLILDLKRQNKFYETMDLIDYHTKLVNDIFVSFKSELATITKLIDECQTGEENILKTQHLDLIRDWRKNMLDRFDYLEKSNNEFFSELGSIRDIRPRRNLKKKIIDFFNDEY